MTYLKREELCSPALFMTPSMASGSSSREGTGTCKRKEWVLCSVRKTKRDISCSSFLALVAKLLDGIKEPQIRLPT